MGDTDWPSDDAPLYAGADRDYHANTDLLRRLRDVSRSIEMTIDGISIRTGYFFYLHMKLYRRTSAQGGHAGSSGITALRRELRNALKPKPLPAGQSGDLRLDHPVDLYESPAGIWNKNIGIQCQSVVLATPAMPAFVPDESAQISQAISLAPLLHPSSYRWGVAIYDALMSANLPISRLGFWRNHLTYLSRLAGFSARFGKLFDANSFETVHFCRFADVNMQGMLLAARRRGLNAIEYQHGVLSGAHPAVALLDATMPGTVPDKLAIAESIYQGINYGNAKVELISGDATGGTIGETAGASRGILIAMQPRFADDATVLALRMSEDFPHLEFTLRSHPRAVVRAERLPEVIARKNLSYERAEDIESSLSLRDRDGVITGSSTMGLSAAVRGIPSLFAHQEGYDQARELVTANAHLVSHAQTYTQIRDWLRTIRSQ
ncbi:hypothetical protein [Devosia ginsengisoli]|uniref:hypothetical protein n=1 Tax=Devosia ginsengisoli TaxID=400770 RepID=UPI0026EB893D|nr:hypothetical protein [Devosia ginsengisoli]MCR6672058.1 hypothetical protein [Devosia ginsengisoli]